MTQDIDPLALMRRHPWAFAAMWSPPAAMAAAVLLGDFFPNAEIPTSVILIAVSVPLWVGTFMATRLKAKTGISWPLLYAIWLVPPMVLWIGFVLLRVALFAIIRSTT